MTQSGGPLSPSRRQPTPPTEPTWSTPGAGCQAAVRTQVSLRHPRHQPGDAHGQDMDDTVSVRRICRAAPCRRRLDWPAGGTDTLTGGAGTTPSPTPAPPPPRVTIDLDAGTASDGDTLDRDENVTGSAQARHARSGHGSRTRSERRRRTDTVSLRRHSSFSGIAVDLGAGHRERRRHAHRVREPDRQPRGRRHSPAPPLRTCRARAWQRHHHVRRRRGRRRRLPCDGTRYRHGRPVATPSTPTASRSAIRTDATPPGRRQWRYRRRRTGADRPWRRAGAHRSGALEPRGNQDAQRPRRHVLLLPRQGGNRDDRHRTGQGGSQDRPRLQEADSQEPQEARVHPLRRRSASSLSLVPPGRNTLRFSGKLGGQKLKAGLYRATALAAGAGGKSGPATAKFTVSR